MATKKKSLLQEELKNADYMDIISNGSKSKIFRCNDNIDYSYKTGITLIDYAFGYELNIFDPNTDEFIKKRFVLGLQAGTFNVITGRTQSFKTTLTIKIAANIAYANSMMDLAKQYLGMGHKICGKKYVELAAAAGCPKAAALLATL